MKLGYGKSMSAPSHKGLSSPSPPLPFPLPPSPPLPFPLLPSQASSVTINETSPSEMTEGSDIVLECLFDNGRPAENVTWLFEDQPVSQLGGSNVQQVWGRG